MPRDRRLPLLAAAFLAASVLAAPSARAQAPAGGGGELEQHLGALKQSLATSAQNLRKYQWVETTTVSMKGEVKSQSQQSCYYGADGKVQKTTLSATPPPKKKGGLRGKIQAEKTGELKAEVKQAVALVHAYAPPDPARIQACKEAGRLSFDVLQPGKVVRMVCKDYLLPGDSLAMTVDLSRNQLTALDVSTYLDEPSAPVTLAGQFANLADGTSYLSSMVLGLPAEKLSVSVANSGYRPM